jgi:hypothetical protein
MGWKMSASNNLGYHQADGVTGLKLEGIGSLFASAATLEKKRNTT